LDRIPAAQLSAADRVNHAILRRGLAEEVEGWRLPQRNMLFTTYYGWHQGFAGMADNLPFRTRADYESYLTRIEQYSRLNDQALAITAEAVRTGHVLPCSVLTGYERTIGGVIAQDPGPVALSTRLSLDPARATSTNRNGARCRRGHGGSSPGRSTRPIASTSISTRPNTAHAAPPPTACRRSRRGGNITRCRSAPNTTTDLTPQQIHEIGMGEVRRILSEMDTVTKEAGFASRQAFVQDLRTNPRHFTTNPEALMREVARVTREIDGTCRACSGRCRACPTPSARSRPRSRKAPPPLIIIAARRRAALPAPTM
jgi:uncharacterized protein (DUF885 family)